ncbi:MAG: hypothetical protein WCB04_03230 [Mycobacteriales bacterium]
MKPSQRLAVRRAVVAIAVAVSAVGVLAVANPAQASCAPSDPCASLPAVNMSRLVLAATLDPWRVDNVETVGAGDSVKLVEQALHQEGLLAASAIDGYYGTATIAAFGKYEVNRLGETSRGSANGIPGLSELQTLGAGRFRLINDFEVGKQVHLKSVANGGNSADGTDVINERTQAMFLEAQRIMRVAGQVGSDMVIVQGGYCYPSCAAASAGVHNAGGALDIRVWDTTDAGRSNRVAALRKVGFAAWCRCDSSWGSNTHIHAVAINDYQMSWEAHGDGSAPAPLRSDYGGNCQIFEFKYFEDGLTGCDDKHPSNDPSRNLVTWEEYLAS